MDRNKTITIVGSKKANFAVVSCDRTCEDFIFEPITGTVSKGAELRVCIFSILELLKYDIKVQLIEILG